jgi:hypothetical protein
VGRQAARPRSFSKEDAMDKAKVEKFLELLDEIVNEDGPLGN